MSRPPPRLLSIIIPCFNEEAVIRTTNSRLLEVLEQQQGLCLELIYVNDGSRDATEEILLELASRNPQIKLISFTRNFGHQQAVTAGLHYASGDLIAIIDADLQDPPEVIPEMIGLWRQGYDVVYGIRSKRKESLWKRAAYAGFYQLFQRVAEMDAPRDSGDFSILDRSVVDALNQLPEKNRFVRGLRAWVGYRQVGLVYERASRFAGEPKYDLPRLLKLSMDGILNFSTTPLNGIFFMGVGVAFFASVAGVFVFLGRLFDIRIMGHAFADAPGFTTLFLALAFFSGVQLLSLGILGAYLGRIFQEVKMRPTFLIKNTSGFPATDQPPLGSPLDAEHAAREAPPRTANPPSTPSGQPSTSPPSTPPGQRDS